MPLILAILLTLTPVQCADHADGEIEVRGFLRSGPGELLYLCEDPGVRSCCLGKGEGQVLVEGLALAELPQGAVTLKGVFRKGVLDQARLDGGNYDLPSRTFTLIGALVLIVGNGALFLLRRRRSRRSA